jgi:hypothetical protein
VTARNDTAAGSDGTSVSGCHAEVSDHVEDVVDPVSLIVAALAAGAVAGAQNTATEAVTDAYGGLKRLVATRLRGRQAAEVALAQHELRPRPWRGALEAELTAADLGRDPAVVQAAREVMSLVDPAGFRSGKYVVDLRGAQGVQVGDRNVQNNTFHAPPRET